MIDKSQTEIQKPEPLPNSDIQTIVTPSSPTIGNTLVVGSAFCQHGYKGACCCNCKYQLKLYSHPLNVDFGKGSIMQQCGWACINPEICKGESAIFFDKEHGMCECWAEKVKGIFIIPADYDEGPELEYDGCEFCNNIHCGGSCQDDEDW